MEDDMTNYNMSTLCHVRSHVMTLQSSFHLFFIPLLLSFPYILVLYLLFYNKFNNLQKAFLLLAYRKVAINFLSIQCIAVQ